MNVDLDARRRWARLLYAIGGWDIFSAEGERGYVSKLWSEDWDSPEDTVYDNDH